jgi:PAS domain S-box-containing protein
MSGPTILLVEDSGPFRRAAREMLSAHGYAVAEAADGAAALGLLARNGASVVLLDTSLPDFRGADLLSKLRALPGGEGVPVVALLGFLARPDDGDLAAAGFDDFLVKPLEEAALVECVATHLAWAGASRGKPGRGKRVLLVDDDPDHLAVARIRLVLLGFDVETAADGEEALAKARARRPDVVASDVLMPRLDGLGLCAALRKDPALARVPVVLFSGHYVEKADRRLAEDAGASAFVARTGDLMDLAGKVLEFSGASAEPVPAPTSADIEAERRRRALLQLERQASLHVRLTRTNRLLHARLGLLAAVAEALAGSGDLGAALRDAFTGGFDSWGVGPAALYTLGADGSPVFQARSGWSGEAATALEGFFGHGEFARRALESRDALLVRPTGDRKDPEEDFLEAAGARSALVVPLLGGGEGLGVLLLASARDDLADPEVRDFAKAVAGQLAQAVSLARAVDRLRTSEERYRCLVEKSHDGLLLTDPNGEILEANGQAAGILGRAAEGLLRHRLRDFAAPDAADTGWDALGGASAGEPVHVEGVLLARPDGTTLPVEVTASRVRVGSRELVLVILRDISRRRALERRHFQAQKMEANGQLAGGMPRVLDLPAALGELEADLRKLAGEKAELALRYAMGTSPVKIDPSQLEQVLVQVVLNARESFGEGPGRIAIEVEDVEVDEAFVGDNEGARAGPHVRISVVDDGRGMSEETLGRAFEPFFTTKEPGKGSGLGLATVYGIVKQNEGYVKVESRAGEGTAIRIYLPRVQPVVAGPSKRPAPAERTGRKAETVLVVEDEWAVRSLIDHVLRDAGYTVLEADNGQAALELAGKVGARIDLLLTDVVMPGMSGREVARRLRAERADLRVVFMSGYSYDALFSDEDGGVSDFLPKPFPPDLLLEKVEALLRAAPAGRGPEEDSGEADPEAPAGRPREARRRPA